LAREPLQQVRAPWHHITLILDECSFLVENGVLVKQEPTKKTKYDETEANGIVHKILVHFD
jgi:hypothetical protein